MRVISNNTRKHNLHHYNDMGEGGRSGLIRGGNNFLREEYFPHQKGDQNHAVGRGEALKKFRNGEVPTWSIN